MTDGPWYLTKEAVAVAPWLACHRPLCAAGECWGCDAARAVVADMARDDEEDDE